MPLQIVILTTEGEVVDSEILETPLSAQEVRMLESFFLHIPRGFGYLPGGN